MVSGSSPFRIKSTFLRCSQVVRLRFLASRCAGSTPATAGYNYFLFYYYYLFIYIYFFMNYNFFFYEYSFLLIYIFICFLIATALYILSVLIIPKWIDDEKISAYECGFSPSGDARNKIEIKFYLTAILFIVFDVEVVFLFPWVITFS